MHLRTTVLFRAHVKHYNCFLFLCLKGGIYIFNIFNTYACAGWALLTLMIFECVAVSWGYGIKRNKMYYGTLYKYLIATLFFNTIGIDRFYENINEMIGYYPGKFWKYCWMIITPTMCLVINLHLIKFIHFKVTPFNTIFFIRVGHYV